MSLFDVLNENYSKEEILIEGYEGSEGIYKALYEDALQEMVIFKEHGLPLYQLSLNEKEDDGEGFGKKVVEMIKKIWEAVKDFFGKIWSAIKKAVDWIKGKLREAQNKFKEIYTKMKGKTLRFASGLTAKLLAFNFKNNSKFISELGDAISELEKKSNALAKKAEKGEKIEAPPRLFTDEEISNAVKLMKVEFELEVSESDVKLMEKTGVTLMSYSDRVEKLGKNIKTWEKIADNREKELDKNDSLSEEELKTKKEEAVAFRASVSTLANGLARVNAGMKGLLGKHEAGVHALIKKATKEENINLK